MYLTFYCPKCEQTNRSPEIPESMQIACSGCDWSRPISEEAIGTANAPSQCLRCGNPDLWRQKNFPQSLGFLFVAAGAVSSSIAWYYHRPITALAILMGFALLDMALYLTMPDVLVCYRCQSTHHRVDVSGHAAFDHELGERYRQEKIRLAQSKSESA